MVVYGGQMAENGPSRERSSVGSAVRRAAVRLPGRIFGSAGVEDEA